MGNLTDPMAVVDSQARVIGVNKLRVVDASSFALLPPGHPQSTVCKYGRIRFVIIANHFADLMAEKISADIVSGH
jgi:choline dehydrogenase-like flavoprotein